MCPFHTVTPSGCGSTEKPPDRQPSVQFLQSWTYCPVDILFLLIVVTSFLLSSVQFSHSVMSNSFRPRGLKHARLLCPSPTPGACSNSCPSSRWCHPTISSSVVPFSSCLQSFPAFPMSQFFASGVQSIEASASALPMNIQD